MDATRRLFDEDPRLMTFSANVISCEKEKKMYKAVLDETAFFPEEGGQTCDKGTLAGQNIEKVIEKDGIIYHYLKSPLEVGATVNGIIDWDKRFSDMQQHTGEHIVSGLMHNLHSFDNVGFHLGSEYVTMDFNGVITRDELLRIEYEANKAVAADLPIQVTWPDEAALKSLRYRSKKELEGPVRIVEIPGVDICACCAPHVHRTGEIGIIKLIRMENYKGGIRVYMLCGFRALADYDEKLQTVYRISETLSLKPDKTADGVIKQKEELNSLREQLNLLKWEYVENDMKALLEGTSDKNKAICLFSKYLDKTNMPRAWKALSSEHDGLCACFAGDDTAGYQFVLGGRNTDAKEAGNKFVTALNGRGGGSSELFQGRISSGKTEILDFFRKN